MTIYLDVKNPEFLQTMPRNSGKINKAVQLNRSLGLRLVMKRATTKMVIMMFCDVLVLHSFAALSLVIYIVK